jgi:hypothetical protein
MSGIGDLIRSIGNGTADNGATAALWYLTETLNGRAVLDLGEPPPGWRLRVQPHPRMAGHVLLVSERVLQK